MHQAPRTNHHEPVDMSAVPITEIHAVRGLVPLNLHELWEYRDLAFFFLWRDLKGRYRQMAFGPLWMIVNPIVSVMISTIIFSKLAKLPSDGIPYPLFNMVGMMAWNFFATCQGAASGSLLGYKEMMSKVYFPRLLIPLIGILTSLVDILILFIMNLAMMFYFGYIPGWHILVLPLYFLLAAITGLAIGLWTAAWIVHFRDVGAVLGYVFRAWMYATPLVYASSLIPEKWQFWYHLNPMTNVVEGFRWSLLGVGEKPGWMLVLSFVIVIPLMISGAYYYRRTERNIVDIA